MFKKSITLSLLLSTTLLLANDEILLEDDFLQSLDEVTHIATKTKLNIDDSPAFVTVLTSQKLQKLGIRDIYEALSLVPGVKLHKESSGVPVVVFRGATQKGEVKLMVDGVTINNSYRGSIYHYLDFPIELINRIEIIRGSAGVLYGSNAVSGIINIITHSSKKEKINKIFTSTGSYSTHKGGAIVSTNISDFKLSLDSYYQRSDKAIASGADKAGIEGDADHRFKDYSFGMTLQNDNFNFLARFKKSDYGTANGLFNYLDNNKNEFNNINKSVFTQLSYKTNLSENNKINLSTGFSSYKQIIDTSLSTTKTLNSKNKEYSYNVQAELVSESIKNNELVIGIKFEKSKAEYSSLILNETVELTPLIDPKSQRKVSSLYFNNTYSGIDSFRFSLGLRFDDYSDFGDVYSPSFGMVYSLNNKIKLKTTYAHSFRAPSWIEFTKNNSLEAEDSDTLEVGLVYKKNISNTFRLNLYSMRIDNMIVKDSVQGYAQSDTSKFNGVELEYTFIPSYNSELNLVASYIDAKDSDNNEIANVANFISSASFIYEFDNCVTLGSVAKYLSKTSREIDDTRDKMADSFLFDQTVSYSHKEFTFSATVKDLFNNGTKYISPKDTYKDDLADSGRTFFINASWEF